MTNVTFAVEDVDKTRNMEHPETFRNIPEHRIIIKIMRKRCKIIFLSITLNNKKLVLAQNTYVKKRKHRRTKKTEEKLKGLQCV